jgi:hypothetical protein
MFNHAPVAYLEHNTLNLAILVEQVEKDYFLIKSNIASERRIEMKKENILLLFLDELSIYMTGIYTRNLGDIIYMN